MKIEDAVAACAKAVSTAEETDAVARRYNLWRHGADFGPAMVVISQEAASALLFALALAHPGEAGKPVDASMPGDRERYLLAREIWIATSSDQDIKFHHCFELADSWLKDAGPCP